MATQIEILGLNGNTVKVVFYYPVPDKEYLPSSVDMSRVPLSGNLTPTELENLRSGRMFEVVTLLTKERRKKANDFREIAVEHYKKGRKEALRQYAETYGITLLNSYYDGSEWSQ